MKNLNILQRCFWILIIMLFLSACSGGSTSPETAVSEDTSSTLEPTPEPTLTPEPTPTPEPTLTPEPTPTNSAPQSVSVSASPVQICPGDTTKLIAVATDMDNDQLQYIWTSNLGTINNQMDTPSGNEAQYQAATITGADVITLTILDGQGGQAITQTNVEIRGDCPAKVTITSPNQTLTCSRPEDVPGACGFTVEGTTESVVTHSDFNNLRLYVLVFPEDPPGAGWYIQVQPGSIQSDGTWTQSPTWIGDPDSPTRSGDTIKLVAVIVSKDATVNGIKGDRIIKDITGQNNDNVVLNPKDIEGEVGIISDEIKLTVSE